MPTDAQLGGEMNRHLSEISTSLKSLAVCLKIIAEGNIINRDLLLGTYPQKELDEANKVRLKELEK